MKRILYYGLMAVIAIAMFSCTDKEIISVSNGVVVTGSFSSGTARTAYTVGESSVSVTWEAGDQIGIISASDNTVYQYTAATSGSTTDFEPVDSKIENIDGETFYAWYPNNGNSSSNALLPNIYAQSYNKNGISSKYDFIYSKGEISNNELNLSFSHLFAFLKITIDPELLDDASGIVLYSSENISVRTEAYYSFSSDSIVGSTYNYVFYRIDDEYLESDDILTCYIPILPTSGSCSIEICKRVAGSTSNSFTRGDAIAIKSSPADGFQAGYVYATTISENEVEEAKELEREALIALYQATDGDNWTNNENWCTDADISEWYGVSVYSTGLVRSLSLNNNGLSGEIPSEIGNLTQLVGLYLQNNELSGEIPSEIGNLTQLVGLYLQNNELSGEIPSEIGNLTQLTSLNLYGNELSSDIPAEIGNLTRLTNLDLAYNDLSGKIPSEIGNLTQLTTINLYNNELSGEIPSGIGNLTQLTRVSIKNNELSGEIPSEIGNLTQLAGLYLNDNNLTGNLPVSMANLSALEAIDLTMNKLSGVIPDEIVNCEWWNNLGYDGIIYQQEGYGLTIPNMYESTDYSQDGEVYTLQEHTIGNGIKVVILGEAYSDRLIADGTYKTHVDWAYDALFSEEPYTTFKDYFDVYYVNVVSANEILGENTAFQVNYETERGTLNDTDSDIVKDYLSNLSVTNYQYNNITAVVLINTALDIRSVTKWSSSTGFSAAYCVADEEEHTTYLVVHEACGHGLGRLADEYTEYEGEYEKTSTLETYHSKNIHINVDTESDPDEVTWSYFLNDSRYDNENIGIYEGADHYTEGVYRSTETSIMNRNAWTAGFNAISRQSCYRRIMELSGQTYNFEEFLEYDEVNRQKYATGETRLKNVSTKRNWLMGSAPIMVE